MRHIYIKYRYMAHLMFFFKKIQQGGERGASHRPSLALFPCTLLLRDADSATSSSAALLRHPPRLPSRFAKEKGKGDGYKSISSIAFECLKRPKKAVYSDVGYYCDSAGGSVAAGGAGGDSTSDFSEAALSLALRFSISF